MKRSLLVMMALVMSSAMLYSQAYEKGDHGINLGIGFGNAGYIGSYYTGFIPSISGSYEYGIVEVPMGAELTGVVSVGGYLGWSTGKYDYWSNDIKRVYTNFIFGARGNYHFIFHDKLDTYAGIWLGYRLTSWKWTGDGTIPPGWSDTKGSAFVGGAYVGARWFFTPSLAAYAELGYLISVFNFGVTFKIPGNN